MAQEIQLADGRRVMAEPVEFDAVKEDWNEYELEDDTRVRIKTVVVKMFRVLDDDGNPAVTDDGDPWVVARNVRHMVAEQN